MTEKSKQSPDNFIAKIVKDPRSVPETLMLTGYLGASSEPAHKRLYFDIELASYIEIPEDAILHHENIQTSAPITQDFVWIKKDAIVIHGKVGIERKHSKFLEGEIVNDHLAASPYKGGVGNPGAYPPTYFVPCKTNQPDCPTRDVRHGICFVPTRICEFEFGPARAQQEPQPFAPLGQNQGYPYGHQTTPDQPNAQAYTVPVYFCRTASAPLCPPPFTMNRANCMTRLYDICGYTRNNRPVCVSLNICPTQPRHICPPAETRMNCATNSPICNYQTTYNCFQPPVDWPTISGCPSIACGFDQGFPDINQGY